jgi:hypothetical protein
MDRAWNIHYVRETKANYITFLSVLLRDVATAVLQWQGYLVVFLQHSKD